MGDSDNWTLNVGCGVGNGCDRAVGVGGRDTREGTQSEGAPLELDGINVPLLGVGLCLDGYTVGILDGSIVFVSSQRRQTNNPMKQINQS